MHDLQIESLTDAYYSALAIATAYYKRANQPHLAHKYAHNISMAAEYANKAKALGRLVDKL